MYNTNKYTESSGMDIESFEDEEPRWSKNA